MSPVSAPTRALLLLSLVKGVGPATLKKVAAIPGFHELPLAELQDKIPSLHKALSAPGAWQKASDECEQQVAQAASYDAQILSGVDPAYPKLLCETPDDPFILFVRGKLAVDASKSVAIIGTREPTQHGEQIAERITSFFAEHQWSVVSGLAIGCDAVAHRTALSKGAHTVAVLAHGLQTIAPTRHRDLADDILAAGGALVTEYKFGQDVQKQQYVKRDRIQAGMARGVVMVQSDVVGGSLHATRASIEYGRWIAVPFPTQRDLDKEEPKVQANVLIATGSDQDRAELLRCERQDLKRILVLRSKQDYRRLVSPDPVGEDARHASEPPEVHAEDLAFTTDPVDDAALETSRASGADHRVFRYEASPQALRARARYIAGKVKELDTMFQCMNDPTTAITPEETRIELESVLLQMRQFAVTAKRIASSDPVLGQTLSRFLRQLLALEDSIGPQERTSERLLQSPHPDPKQEYLGLEEAFWTIHRTVENLLQTE